MAKKSAEERGYIPVEDAVKGLRQLADDIERTHAGRLAKFSINVWYQNRVSPAGEGGRVESRQNSGDARARLDAKSEGTAESLTTAP